MKLIAIAFLFVAVVTAQDGVTVTEGLVEAQADLTLTHEFFEQFLFVNRGQISAYMYQIQRPVITSHMDAYANIRNSFDEAEAALDATNPSSTECLAGVRNRVSLQRTR